MHLSTALLGLISVTSAINLPSPKRLFTNAEQHNVGFTVPTIHESAVQARRILRLESIGTLSTVFPASSRHATEDRPSVDGAPIGLMDYFGDCEPDTGNPTILAITIATSFKNVDAGSNITLSMRWHPQDNVWRSPASLPRFSLVGHLEEISSDEASKASLTTCFVKYHPDAAWWLPGNRIHRSKWVRLVVDEVYWIGGFGDRAYIGWIPTKEWYSVTPEEIEAVRLPGEKKSGWTSWRSLIGLADDESIEL